MMLRHVGIRPTYPIHLVNFKKKIYYEDLPDGTERRWTLRMLNSGCGGFIGNGYKRENLRGCVYCPWCDEWFSEDQWRLE